MWILLVFLVLIIIGLLSAKMTFRKEDDEARLNEQQKIQEETKNMPAVKEEVFRLAGVNYCIDNIKELEEDNPDYEMSKSEIWDSGMDGEKIYQHEYPVKEVTLIDEPDNPHDKNAVAVYADGHRIGYIKKAKCSRIKNLRKSNSINGLDLNISGGKYKYVYDKDDKPLLDKNSDDYYARLTVYIKAEDQNGKN